MSKELFIGLDPSASPIKASGISVINSVGKVVFLGKWHENEELLKIIASFPDSTDTIAIDGPLQPPHELRRCCFSAESAECPHQQTTPFKGRYCEQLLLKRGFRCFVSSKNSFAKKWMERCFQLNDFLHELALETIEVFPHATRKILFPELQGRKQKREFRTRLQVQLEGIGIKFPAPPKIYSHDELDAVLAAITNVLYVQGKTEKLGDEQDGYIHIPRNPGTHLQYII
ncbi:MAG: DUF429 domain-containing protein [bacterium]|nr:MAG: DUF429 domain-containing protein [bacterium]